nr:hypothetical protein [Methylobacterium sp.]
MTASAIVFAPFIVGVLLAAIGDIGLRSRAASPRPRRPLTPS